MIDTTSLHAAAEALYSERSDYFKQWLFDQPICVRRATYDDLSRVQGLFARLIRCYVKDYKQYVEVDPRLVELLDKVAEKPYRIGTYRTDFVLNSSGHVKLIETTCRYPMNGVFVAGIMNHIARNMDLSGGARIEPYQDIYIHLMTYLKAASRVLTVKGDDARNESKIYEPIFEAAGYAVSAVDYRDLESSHFDFKDALVICELSFEEWASLPSAVAEQLLNSNLINDIRTTFLIHDKRFYVTLGNREFLDSVLNTEDREFFERFYIPTYSSKKDPAVWASARENKDQWIIKHPLKGKSVDIYAGPVTSEDGWQAIFSEADDTDWVLQEWISQKKYPGSIGGEEFNDYLAGTLLFFDESFYGFGDFRMSSFPVTNKKDHRKATCVICEDDADALNQLLISI